MNNLSLVVSLRYLRNGGSQTALMVALVTVGSLVYVFITSLLGGVQASTVESTLGTVSHVTIEPLEQVPNVIVPATRGGIITVSIQRGLQRPDKIAEWHDVLKTVREVPGITTVSPLVSGSGFAIRSSQSKPISILGVDPEAINGIIDLKGFLKIGEINFDSKKVLIGSELARLLSCTVGDKILINSSENVEDSFIVAGIFECGIQDQNERSVYCSIDNAQHLLNIVGNLNKVETKISNVFAAPAIADTIRARTGLKVTPWTEKFRDVNDTLGQIEVSKQMIRSFAMVSVAFGIASVLGVAVAQKGKEIGILKGMGATTPSIIGIFVLQGGFIGLIGATIGSLLGSAMVLALSQQPAGGGNPPLPARLEVEYIWQALLTTLFISLIAGISPALRAAKLDPVEAIRNG